MTRDLNNVNYFLTQTLWELLAALNSQSRKSATYLFLVSAALKQNCLSGNVRECVRECASNWQPSHYISTVYQCQLKSTSAGRWKRGQPHFIAASVWRSQISDRSRHSSKSPFDWLNHPYAASGRSFDIFNAYSIKTWFNRLSKNSSLWFQMNDFNLISKNNLLFNGSLLIDPLNLKKNMLLVRSFQPKVLLY